ncbi:MAG TPA: M20 family metallopeptidase [Candidatus Aminicenantes bacterium]|nr:M20 family metallopeptidase [Candidatus Aminicenantes bacterium]HRY64314.1 M20 family metallopeptidase [Candidatus Aminicenantes bacterium]HRZ71227.1 M20 family metallopeptidase [Candidatus Aminicenantes bacterium]
MIRIPKRPAIPVLAVLALFAALAAAPRPAGAVDPKTARRVDQEIEKNKAGIVKIRRFIHMNPELGNREVETARLIAATLQPLGFEVRTGVAKTGIVAVLRGGQPGPSVAVRADMDALPVQETTGLPYKSLNPGVMHACGHDVHSAIAVGAALVLRALKNDLKGTVTFLFQPAEEGAPEGEEGGADLMVREGALDNPPVSAVFGFHVWPEPTGRVLFATGNVTAASDSFTIVVKGRSAHGARPQEGVDAVVIAAEIVTALQTVVSRASDPTDPAVLTVGTISGGTRRNIIADRVVLEGTIRTLSEANRKKFPALMESIVKNITGIYGAGYQYEYNPGNPSVFNNPELAASMTPTLVRLLGKDRVIEWKPQMIGEDFAFLARKAPGFFFFLGVRPPGQPAAPLHSPAFSPDENAIPIGVRVLCHLVLDALEGQSALAAGRPAS